MRFARSHAAPARDRRRAVARRATRDGSWLAVAAFVVAAVVARPATRRPLAITAALVLALDLPWRVWRRLNEVGAGSSITDHLSPWYLARHAERFQPAAADLWHELWRVQSWSFLVPFLLLGIVGALVQRRGRLALFSGGWAVLSFAGLVAIYRLEIAAPDVVGASPELGIASLVLAGALLVPLLLHSGPEPVSAPGPHAEPLGERSRSRPLEPRSTPSSRVPNGARLGPGPASRRALASSGAGHAACMPPTSGTSSARRSQPPLRFALEPAARPSDRRRRPSDALEALAPRLSRRSDSRSASPPSGRCTATLSSGARIAGSARSAGTGGCDHAGR